MLSSLAWVYNVYCFVFIPQNAQTTQKPTGLTFGIHRAYRRCASYDRRHRIDSLCSVAEVKHGSPPWRRKQSFLWILASRSVGHSVGSKP